MADDIQATAAAVNEHSGSDIRLPKGMNKADAIQIIENLIDAEDEPNQFSLVQATINASPYDGAYALIRALQEIFGFTVQRLDANGNRSKVDIQIDAKGNSVTIPWGRFSVPGMNGWFSTSIGEEEGRQVLLIQAYIQGKDLEKFEQVKKRTQELILTESIYRAKAMNITFELSPAGIIPRVRFMDTDDAFRPIFCRSVEKKIDDEVIGYLKVAPVIKKSRGRLKRGFLLEGPFGTGKSLTAQWVAQTAVALGFTFIYCTSDQILEAASFSRSYEPAIIFAEDIDLVVGLQRHPLANATINIIDGVDTKNSDLIIILTTNFLGMVNPALIRPGRVDVIISVPFPDEEAAFRLVVHYADLPLEPPQYLEACRLLATSPASAIEEAVFRSRMRALRRTDGENQAFTPEELYESAMAIKEERQLTESIGQVPEIIQMGAAAGQALGETLVQTIVPVLFARATAQSDGEDLAKMDGQLTT